MTSSSVNFSFLDNISPDLDGLHRYARQAEMYLHSDPNSCLLKLRQFGELLAQEIAVRNGESIFQDEAQYDLLCRLRNKGILRQKSSDPFHRIREDGNQASHDRLDDHNRALKRLKDAHHLACCFYKTHIKECEIATFTVPLNLEIDLDIITQQLSSVTESNDLLNDRLRKRLNSINCY
jgi:type I restriction enzyme, R subunit